MGVLIEFIEDDKGYVAWLAGHPDGFVLNCERPPRPAYLMLHRATCWTISGAPSARSQLDRDLPEGLR